MTNDREAVALTGKWNCDQCGKPLDTEAEGHFFGSTDGKVWHSGCYRITRPPPSEPSEDDAVKYMVQRFLMWRLPDDFHPDAGIAFNPFFNVEYMAARGKPPMRHNPVGTNLFSAAQAEAMVRYMIVPRSRSRSMCGHWPGRACLSGRPQTRSNRRQCHHSAGRRQQHQLSIHQGAVLRNLQLGLLR